MKKIFGILVCTLMIAAVVLPATGTINEKVTRGNKVFDTQTDTEFVPGEFIVKLKKDVTFSRSSLMVLNEKYKVCALEKVFNNAKDTILDNIYLLHVPIGSDILSIVKEYTLCSDVVYAEPNGIPQPCIIPDDANFSIQWALQNTGQKIKLNIHGTPGADIHAPGAWNVTTGSADVVIAIIDSGVDYTHPDLAANIWTNKGEIPGNGIDDDHNGYIDDVHGWDFFHNNNDPKDGYGHGTLCAGAACAVTNNGIGIAGVGFNCKIMPVRIADESYNTTLTIIAAGIKYAADNGANIISMSFGFTSSSTTLQNVVNYAYDKGVFLCAAAGNSNNANKIYPGGYDNVVAVAATNQNDKRCIPQDWGVGYGSNYGDWVDIAAPGNLIYTTTPTYHVTLNDYGFKQNYDYAWGTSLSSPIVAGVASLLLSKNPSLSADDVKAFICGNVDPYNSTEYIGTGRINAQKALTALIQSPNAPTITGPNSGKPGDNIEYKLNAVDPSGNQVKYIIDWGDGKANTTNLNPSGADVTITHTWSKKGDYKIKAHAQNENGLNGSETTKTVTMPRNRATNFNSMLMRFLERFPFLGRILNLQ